MGSESSSDFDAEVKKIRAAGVSPKCTGKKKMDCTPHEWAAHREYMRARYADPELRAMHKRNQIKHLCKPR
jgi:hypothetical protein